MVNSFCNQTLRSTIDTEQRSGPNYRFTVQQDTGNGRFILQRWPVAQVLAVQVSPNAAFPRQWTQVPTGMWDVENPTLGVYGSSSPSSAAEGGQSILLAPGFFNWALGRDGYRVSVSYTNGWPHAGLTVNASAGATSIQVDDVTGFGITDVTGFTGATARIYDGASTETVQVTSVAATSPVTLPNGGGTAAAGPGTLTLAAPLTFAHTGNTSGNGVVVSAFPENILWATTLAAMTQAIESGITSVSIQNVSGSQTAGGHGIADLGIEFTQSLEPYRRVI